ncbi:uncharacterized protein SPSC_02871 [Sporisorium scitamineum]|uniref:PIN domain-containing protein n=1 Tax=Sporisorium scitamineum TaxID=49012 RepID=A0A0F7S349_9BASI|nr:uncharacterized protein SPSC_02871 [Sporisorium scitamineum]CDW96736.1 hypothetical protein [Sporisorium scitamineum]
MPDETTQQKAERQTRLSHAMGVMFLQDKVDKLEQDVSKITYPRGMHKTRSAPAPNTRHHGAAATQVRAQPRAVTGPGVSTQATTDRDSNETSKVATSIRLVDASVLIFSLRSVHNWSRDQSTCVVIPLEAINTLDLLKKGDEPINLAARKATRWLEDKIAVSTQDGDAMLLEPAPGIFAQKEHFRVASAQIAKARQARLDQLQSDSVGGGQDEPEADIDAAQTEDMFNASNAPRYLRELLSVCLYCHATATAAPNYAVAIAYPPNHLQEAMLEAQSATNDQPSFLNRTDGRATEAWLDAYGIPFKVVPTSKTWTGEKPSSRFRGEIVSDQHSVGSSEDLAGLLHSAKAQQQRRKGSPTPSVSSSTGSFKSELSGLSMLSSQKSPRLRQESRFGATTAPLRSVRCMSTSAAAANSAPEATTPLSGTEDFEAQHDSTDEDGPIIARPSSAASSHTSFVSSLTTSTQDEWSSQTSASFPSHCGTRIVRHAPSPSPSPSAVDYPMSSTPASAPDGGFASPRLTSRTLHKTKSGAEKMEEYLRRLEAGAAGASSGGGEGRTATATPTPGASRSG